MRLDLHLAGVDVEIEAVGNDPKIIGFYADLPRAKGAPKARIRARVDPEFHVGREKGPSYPAFESEKLADGWRFYRYDAAGTVRDEGGCITGDFDCGFSPNSLEAVIRIVMSIALPRVGSLILHSSAVADRRGALVFSGISGAGKSTIAAMLDEAYPVTKLSDELLLLQKRPDGFWLLVAPFVGSRGLPHGDERQLHAVHLLEQWPDHQMEPVSSARAMGEMAKHVLTYARDPQTHQCVLDLLAELVSEVPIYRLRFAKRADVGEVLGITC